MVAQFGYDSNFYCAERREACVANSAAFDENNPFYWASETYAGLACGSGCRISMPAITGRVLYYRILYRSASEAVLATGPTAVVAVP